MNFILCIFLIAAVIFLFFTLCVFALQAARAALPKYEVPPTAYSYQIDHQTDDIGRCVAKHAPASGNPHQHILVINAANRRAAFCAYENAVHQGDSPAAADGPTTCYSGQDLHKEVRPRG